MIVGPVTKEAGFERPGDRGRLYRNVGHLSPGRNAYSSATFCKPSLFMLAITRWCARRILTVERYFVVPVASSERSRLESYEVRRRESRAKRIVGAQFIVTHSNPPRS